MKQNRCSKHQQNHFNSNLIPSLLQFFSYFSSFSFLSFFFSFLLPLPPKMWGDSSSLGINSFCHIFPYMINRSVLSSLAPKYFQRLHVFSCITILVQASRALGLGPALWGTLCLTINLLKCTGAFVHWLWCYHLNHMINIVPFPGKHFSTTLTLYSLIKNDHIKKAVKACEVCFHQCYKFSIFKELCNHHLILSLEHFHHHKENSCSTQQSLPILFSPFSLSPSALGNH